MLTQRKQFSLMTALETLQVQKPAGLHTVIVGSSVVVPGADHALGSIHNIKEAIPEIWETEEGEQLEQVIQPASVETAVVA
ncbi:Haloacid dehalogenase-like hydrolase (HAD) superfamily protein [Melia azedarach]|uniref:Haloacid dehalogenase-like hydrolase (HAD) superfamily protein n=1 Tax=Melia azedarach TaxID=155640 RepID=A0ACC1YXQ1_MELAZ|nr:Haloacid dehalogenase-like hydrolase (HAD) superfamily protein [Melia azedarach]